MQHVRAHIRNLWASQTSTAIVRVKGGGGLGLGRQGGQQNAEDARAPGNVWKAKVRSRTAMIG